MKSTTFLKLHPADNVVVALQSIPKNETLEIDGNHIVVRTEIPAKHKVALADLDVGAKIWMYGLVVGKATQSIQQGDVISTANIVHEALPYGISNTEYHWSPPSAEAWRNRTFEGYLRGDGQVGTRNYWLVVPLVFCENVNIEKIKRALDKGLGYDPPDALEELVSQLVHGVKPESTKATPRVFKNVDGIKFLTHTGGCGGTREDAENLVNLIAGYYANPNVGGLTVLSLGCQHSQPDLLEKAISSRFGAIHKPIQIFEQQQYGTTASMLEAAVKSIIEGVQGLNQVQRSPQPLNKLCIGLKCGGSDGFSGLTANPAMGYLSDLLASLGGKSILAEFPELFGVEQNLIDRCEDRSTAEKFVQLMESYNAKAVAIGSGFSMNPSPGNIRDGLITDAMKSAGAAKKGGLAPISGVLDYTEYASKPGLNLLCTPGNDVEATTGMAASGANLIIFSTGLGTPTGNVVVPVIKTATNSALAHRMPDLIDFDHGAIIEGESIETSALRLLERVIEFASGRQTCAEKLRQDDFIPWKRGVSL